MNSALSPRRGLTRACLTAVAVALLGVPVTAAAAAPSPSPSPSTPSPGASGSPQTWGVVPSSAKGPTGRSAFDYKLDPGATLTDYVGIVNPSAADIRLRLYAHDAVTTAGGGFDLLTGDTRPTGAGAWVSFGSPSIVVLARSRLDVPFTLTVPDNATPGDHAGGIVTSLAETTAVGGVAVERRVGARVHVRVSGQLTPHLTVEDVSMTYDGSLNPLTGGRTTATFTVHNSGNVRLAVTTRLVLTGPLGIPAGEAAGEQITQILPGDRVTVTVTAPGTLPLFRLTTAAQATGRTPEGAPATPETTAQAQAAVWALPWPQLAALALLILISWLVRQLKRRSRARLANRIEAARAAGRAEARSRSHDIPSAIEEPAEHSMHATARETPEGQQ